MIVGFSAIFSILTEWAVTPMPAIIKRTWKFYLTVGIIAFPLWFWYATYNIGQKVHNINQPFDFIPNPAVNMGGFLKSIFGNLIGYKLLYPLLIGPMLALILPHGSRLKYMGFFAIMVVLPIYLLCMMDISMEYWFLQRQFVWVIALFSFFVAWGWEDVIFFLINHA
jgi:hypothetical protein